ncbi:hypothetical protein SAMN05444007_108252 [Cribrihabitans marinus]|uniref:Uncharacterized protein n=1 Tax=Cribrihabitans marinus TaxID=1227549 RepID=A0A1H7CQ96_9RHOB|nr:hypothetical protein [Cribrihabitans marinus]GGH36349.1 hypothetical protein GCM10010973_30230 [Cribrihabitans marinus]SEJ91656.1 hypothetical protein SAMN05444007_108252 [Cribrihabitans marinus]
MSAPQPIAASTIAAQAFRYMELAPIGSFADDSPQASAAREQYTLALKTVLEAHDWSFARRLAGLAEKAETDTTDPDMIHLYALPADCVALRHVYAPCALWRQDGLEIRSELAEKLVVRYTALTQNEALLPASFQTAVSLALAVRLAPQYVSSRTKRSELKLDLQEAIAAAWNADRHSASHARLDGREMQPDWAQEATW